MGGLIDINGTSYGTTETGGPDNDGSVHSISTTGTEKVLHGFGGRSDGTFPVAGLIDVRGTLYGTTLSGGTCFVCMAYGSYGTIFSVTTNGTEKVLYDLTGFRDGANSVAGLTNLNGTLYGTTGFGGGSGCYYPYGCRIVFSFTPGGRNVRL
ncbi:MAG TPA: choice-of-anchor tandem repeat GloVer-containing protein [Candidatus Binatia bacterium]|nr:choice-of-anchor tandem repeat GloVer-containing protein [Candidatus Binatia bacterium]